MGYICDDKNVAETVAKAIRACDIQIHGDFRVQLDRHPFALEFWIRSENKDVAHFCLKEQVNCCGLLVSTGTWVKEEKKGQGFAQEMMLLKEELAKVYGYSSMMATVNVTGNPAEVHILEKFGWKEASKFVNSRTKNTVGIFTKNL